MEIALNSDTPGGFKHENAITSQNGLALLASITLKNALNINNSNNNNNNSNNKNKNNITKKSNNNNNNHLTLNQNKNNIKHHKALQPQHGFMSSPAITLSSSATMSSSSITPNTSAMQTLNITEQKNVFTFTTAGLQALTATALSTIQNKAGAVAVDQQKQQQQQQQQALTSAAQTTVAALSSYNNNHRTSIATNHHQTNGTISAKDPTVALLEALSIKTNKKQQNVSTQQQQQIPVSSSTLTTTTTIHSSVCNSGNNNSNNNGSGNGNNNKNNFRIPSDILDDLASRFIINVPDMELSNLIRICFQIELAHWFYLDFFCASEEEKKLQPCGIKQFALKLFEHIPFLRQHLSSIDKILEDWKNYKLSVPTYGAILISEDLNYCLLVQSYFAKSSWGFPKGKVNENEDPVHCATREVYEETGYDITELIVPNDYIEAVINYQYTRLYIVRDVSLETKFSPRTRNEIKCCDWFPIDSLPVNKTDAISKPKLGINANSFFMIMPFVKRLKKWVNDKRNGVETRRKYSGGGSPTATSPLTTTIVMNGQIKSSCKKQKRNNLNNFNDDINALNNNGSGATTATLNNFPCGNNANANVNCSNSNRSKRQRHKSMGDLDGIKLNNFNNHSNCKSTFNNNNNNNNNNNCGSGTTTTPASSSTTSANSGGNLSCSNNNTNNSNQKRYTKIVAAGSNVSNHINNNTNNGCNNNNNNNNVNNGNTLSSKRQLFQSQSQTNNLQQNGEKIVSSFDLIRKEKQQMKAAQAKVQKQHQNLNSNNGRQRAKSQSDKMCMQHQQQQQQQQKSTGNGNNNKQQQQQQQRLQKQQSLIVTNTNMQNYNNNHHNNINNSSKNHNNNITKSNVNNTFNNKMTTGIYKTPTPPPISGNDLLALAAATAAAISVDHTTTEIATSQQGNVPGICCQQQPRPSSASLHFPEASSLEKKSIDVTATGNQMPQYKRMASGTNLRILKRSTSHQPTQQNQQPQPPQRQASALQFTPSFNSWTNFTFTKNFIANVFC